MPNDNSLSFVPPVPIYRPALQSMQLRGNVNEINNLPTPTGEPVTANQLGEAVGARGARGLFGVMGEVIGRRFIGRPGGSLVAEGIYDAVTGYNRGRASRKSLTQLDAKREPAAEGNAPGKVDKGKRKKDRGSTKPPPTAPTASGEQRFGQLPPSGGSGMTMSYRSSNLMMPAILQTDFTTIEGEPLPLFNATIDYHGQIYTYIGSFATYTNVASEVYLPRLYDNTSLKQEAMVPVFVKLQSDLLDITTTKFTDTFTEPNLWDYVQNFTALVELICWIQARLKYETADNYDDYMVGHTFIQGWITSYEVQAAIKRAEQLLLGKFYPPQMVATIFAMMQTYKNAPLPQAINFFVTPRDYLVPTLSDLPDALNSNSVPYKTAMQQVIIDEINFRISKLTTKESVYISKSIGFIRPSYKFTGFPEPSHLAKYDPHMLEHAQNMTRLALFKTTDSTVTAFPASASKMTDRPYNICLDVKDTMASTFALQSMPEAYNLGNSRNQTVKDATNIFTTFAKSYKIDNATVLDGATENVNIDNFFQLAMNASGDIFYSPEALADSLLSGRANILDFAESSATTRTTDPTKFSITPSNCQRVYFNNKFAPTDAVSKLISSFWDARR